MRAQKKVFYSVLPLLLIGFFAANAYASEEIGAGSVDLSLALNSFFSKITGHAIASGTSDLVIFNPGFSDAGDLLNDGKGWDKFESDIISCTPGVSAYQCTTADAPDTISNSGSAYVSSGSTGYCGEAGIKQAIALPADAKYLKVDASAYKSYWGGASGIKMNGEWLQKFDASGQKTWGVQSYLADISRFAGQTVDLKVVVEDKSPDWCNMGDHPVWVRADNFEITTSGAVCGNGICESGESYLTCSDCPKPAEYTACTDSDGGADYYVKGKATNFQRNDVTALEDICVKDNYGYVDETTEKYLFEQDCKDGYGYTNRVYCQNGCKDGACIPSTSVTKACNDSDRGIDYTVKGTATQTILYETTVSGGSAGSASGAGGVSKADYCSSSSDLMEYWCDADNNIQQNGISCTLSGLGSCVDGACMLSDLSNYAGFSSNSIIAYGAYADSTDYSYCLGELKAKWPTNAVKVDNEVTGADKESKNIILLSSPAVNRLVAELAAAGKTPDISYWANNLKDKYLVQIIKGAFATGKDVLVISGYDTTQSKNACNYVLANNPPTTWTPPDKAITVTSPNGGEYLAKESKYYITWTARNLNSPKCAIDLYNSGIDSPVRNIVAEYASNGYSWAIPADISDGNYKVLVRCVEIGGYTTYADQSDNYFSIKASPICGNSICESGESYLSCSDCPKPSEYYSVCGNGKCEEGESYLTCSDCPKPSNYYPVCGNGICDDGETYLSCSDCPKPADYYNVVKIKTQIRTGWNLVSMLNFGSYHKEATCEPSDFKSAYMYFPVERTYGSYTFGSGFSSGELTGVTAADRALFKKYKSPEDTGYLVGTAVNSVWIYSKKNCYVQAEYPSSARLDNLFQEIDRAGLKFSKGWNFFTVLPEMAGRTVHDVSGGCSIPAKGAYMYMNNGWARVDNTALSNGDVGAAILVKVSDDCVFGGLGVGEIPPLPETQSTVAIINTK